MAEAKQGKNKLEGSGRSTRSINNGDEDLADAIQHVNIAHHEEVIAYGRPRPVYETYFYELARAGRMGLTFDERALTFNERALGYKWAVQNGTEPPKEMGRFKSYEQRMKDQLAIVQAWDDYFGAGGLADWARLCQDLGLEGDFSTKGKCRKALKLPWVNICDFLARREEVAFFATEEDLSVYSIATGKIYPRHRIQTGSPLECFIAQINHPPPGKSKVRDEDGRLVVEIQPIAACRTWTLDDEHWIVRAPFKRHEGN